MQPTPAAPAPDHPAELDRAIAVEPLTGATSFAARIDEGWTVGPKPNGGYLLALLANAAGQATVAAGAPHRDPLAATAHYLRAPDPGPATIEVDVLRLGRGASQARAVLVQDGRPFVDATFTLGSLPTATESPTATWSARVPFDLPPPDECPRASSQPPGAVYTVAMMDRCDVRFDPATTDWTVGRPTDRGELRAWISLADGRPADPLALLVFLDTLPPATFDVARSGWVPTLSLTAYVRARPAPGPLRVRQWAQLVADDRVDEGCEIWDSAGRLVGQATQLAAIRLDPSVPPVPYPHG